MRLPVTRSGRAVDVPATRATAVAPRRARAGIALGLTLLLGACRGPSGVPGRADAAENPPPTYRPTATLQELMQLEIDPAADFIWGSVGTVVTRAGTLERQPHTAAEWSKLRGRALLLVESTNLLQMPGRRVASRDFPPDAPGVLGSADIQRQWDASPAAFAAYAELLRGAALAVLLAAEQQDAAALARAGEALDDACEACHRANWYPHQVIPALPATMPIPLAPAP
jgi:hypothetical protein